MDKLKYFGSIESGSILIKTTSGFFSETKSQFPKKAKNLLNVKLLKEGAKKG